MSFDQILVIDHHNEIREIVVAMLKTAGYDVTKAKSTLEALAFLESDTTFDMIFCDASILESDDTPLLEISLAKYPDSPFLLLGTTHQISFMQQTIQRGAYDYLLEPFEHEQLFAKVKRALEYRQLRSDNRDYEDKLKALHCETVSSSLASVGRILVVDDEKPIRELISSMLNAAGYKTRQAGSGIEALALLNQVKGFDLVLSDLMMAELDGIELLERARGIYPDMPFIVVTAVHDISVAVASIRCGAYDYLLKPFDRRYLIAMVKRGFEYRELKIKNNTYEKQLRDLGRDDLIHKRHVLFQSQSANDAPLQNTSSSGSAPQTFDDIQRSLLLASLHDCLNELTVMRAYVIEARSLPEWATDAAQELTDVDVALDKCGLIAGELFDHLVALTPSIVSTKDINDDQLLVNRKVAKARHDLGGQILIIRCAAELVSEMYEKSSNIGSQLKKLLSSIERCADLVRQMESAVVTDNKQDKIANLSELLQKVSAIMMPRLSSGINLMLSKDPRTDNTAVRGDLTILANIMIEIMTNAAKALQPRGGRIDASISLEPNDVVQIVIKDDGPGIPLEVVRRIEDGTILGKSGHGLGLYLCRETVHHFGGQFRVEPLKQGTAVTMILPAVNLQSGDAS